MTEASPPLQDFEIAAMREALDLAWNVKGKTLPNPAVGAVVLRDGKTVGRGATAAVGGPHAEPTALAEAGEAARGGTLVVTLEPCCHQGRTPPCTEAILKAGIRRVVAAYRDPHPRVSGGGFRRLREAGVEVVGWTGAGTVSRELHAEAHDLYRGFAHGAVLGRPWILGKVAQSANGRINEAPGRRTAITGEAVRRWSHAWRQRVDALVVGGQTVRSDDPDLTAREAPPSGGARPDPEVVVVSRTGRFTFGEKVFSPHRRSRTWLLSPSRPAGLPPWVGHGSIPAESDEEVQVNLWMAWFRERGYHAVWLEGGRSLWLPFLKTGTLDALALWTAPQAYPQGEVWLPEGWVRPESGYRWFEGRAESEGMDRLCWGVPRSGGPTGPTHYHP